MLFWIILALMAVGAVLAVLRPLLDPPAEGASRSELDRAVYRDQLAELDADRTAGLIGTAEAGAARAEIARRLIAAAADETPAAAGAGPRRRTALALALAVPLIALGLYLGLGRPQLPDEPLAARLAKRADALDIAALVERVEKHLEQVPGDRRGWQALAPIYMRMGRYDDAVSAYARLVAAGDADAGISEGYGVALVAASGGVVSAQAQKVFSGVLESAPDRPASRFYYAEGLRQSGELKAARAAYDALIARSPADAPWLDRVRERRAEVLAALKQPADTPEPDTLPPAVGPAPSTAAVEAAADMSAADRSAMIAGMVDRLAARLADNPDDREGWKRLLRAYAVLGRADEAKAALARARDVFKADPAALADVEAAASGPGPN